MDRAVRPVPQHPVRQRHPQCLPRHRPAGGCKRTECAAGAVLAQDRAHGVLEPEQHHGGRQVRQCHHSGSQAVPDLLWPDQRRCGGPHDMEQAIRGVQRHRQQAAVVQPAPRRVPGRAAQGLFRHSGAGAAVLPLPHERLREQHPGHWHRRTVRCFHRSCRAGLPALCGADCRWHRGTYHMEQPVRQGVHSADIRAGGHPETPALPRHTAGGGVFRQCGAVLQPAFAAHCLLLYQCGEPAPLRPVHRRDCRRHPQRTGAAGSAADRHRGRRDMDSGGSAEPAACR